MILGWNEAWCELRRADYVDTQTHNCKRGPDQDAIVILTPVFWPCITVRNPSLKVLYFVLPAFSAAIPTTPHPTPLLLTLARGHPPADGTIPAAFDTEFALQPTAISWFCNKLRQKRRLSLSQLHCCDLIWLQGAEPVKKTSKTRRLTQNK